ncbi:velvet factor-domain-containing protein [Gongronella butleri]|nr:velvet factor-domain-containing protein [Gongronella butleri]
MVVRDACSPFLTKGYLSLDRRPIEPPPILQIKWPCSSNEDTKKYLQSPFYFVVANLVSAAEPDKLLLPTQEYLSGTTVSSLYRLRDIDNQDGGFYIFGDLSVKKQGIFKLHFSLFEIRDGAVENQKALFSDTFTVYLPKQFPGALEATFLSRTFSDQGVKMRIRKEHRLQPSNPRKRKSESSSSSSFKETVGDTTSKQEYAQPTKKIPKSAAYDSPLIRGSPTETMYTSMHPHTQNAPPPPSHGRMRANSRTSASSSTSGSFFHVTQTPHDPAPPPPSTTHSPSSSSWRAYDPVTPPSPTYSTHWQGASPPPSTSTSTNATRPRPSIANSLAHYHLSRSPSMEHAPVPAPVHDVPYQPVTPPPLPGIFNLSIDKETNWGSKLPPLRPIMNNQDIHKANWRLPPIPSPSHPPLSVPSSSPLYHPHSSSSSSSS